MVCVRVLVPVRVSVECGMLTMTTRHTPFPQTELRLTDFFFCFLPIFNEASCATTGSLLETKTNECIL